jgi:hypothetical protein
MHHLLRFFLVLPELSSSLGNHSLLLSLAGSLGLRTLGIHLLPQDSLTGLLRLGSVDLIEIVSPGITTGSSYRGLTCSTNARLCLKVLPLLRW